MKTRKKYRILKISISTINGSQVGTLNMDEEDSFDTEEEAIKWAFKQDKWGDWMIITHISFDNF